MARQKNKEDMYRLIGSSNHTGEARGEEDFYASDPASIDGLLEKETFSKHIWEPACGMGHLSDKLKNLGYDVRESDLVLRKEGAEQKDFLFFNEDRFGGDIITNPPYALAQEFVEQSLKCVGEGHKVAMLLRLLFLESIERRRLFDIAPPIRVHVYSKRIRCYKNGEITDGGGALCYAWFVWEKGHKGTTTIDWI